MISTVMLSAMTWVTSTVGSFVARIREERGQDIMEYAILIGAIAVAASIAIFAVGLPNFTNFASALKDCVSLDIGSCD